MDFILLLRNPLSLIPYIVLEVTIIDAAPFDAIIKPIINVIKNPAVSVGLDTDGTIRLAISLVKALVINSVIKSVDRLNVIAP